MTLSEAIARHAKNRNPNKCNFAVLVESLSDEDKKTLDAAIKNQVGSNALAYALNDEGYKIGKETIRRHTLEFCKCYQKK